MTPDDSNADRVLEEVERSRRRVRLVGFFIIGVAVAQVVLTVAVIVDGSRFAPALTLNPRLAWVFPFTFISNRAGEAASVVIALVSSAFGVALVRARSASALFVYLWAEAVFSAPVFMGLTIIVLVGIPHGVSRSDGVVPFAVFAATVLAPWLACLWLYRKLVN